jgi:negative regulator of sigma E activity
VKTRRITIFLISALLILATACLVSHRAALRHSSVSELAVRALFSSAKTDYIAHVVTTTQYNGKRIHNRAILYHQGSTEKLEYSGSKGQRIWSMLKDNKSYTFVPAENSILVSETSRIISDAQRSELLARNYKFIILGSEKVAGRDTYVVKISSRRGRRPAKKLWIDKRYFTVLRSIDYTTTGAERGSMQVQQIHYNARISPDIFKIPDDASAKMVMVCKSAQSRDLFKTVGMRIGTPTYLPDGYVVEGYHVFNARCSCNHRSAQITYTDGLNVISVFQTPKMTSCSDCCNSTNGGDESSCCVENCDMAKTCQMSRSDRTVVVVGDLLPEDVKKITESVK